MKNNLSFVLMLGIALLSFTACRQESNVNVLDSDFQESENKEFTHCSTDDYHEHQLETNSKYHEAHDANELQTAQFVANYDKTLKTRAVITIPVVFHVVYSTAAQNVSNAQIAAQLKVLNDDFRNATGVAGAANVEVQFVMAKRTSFGVATTGIERRQVSSTSFSSDDRVKTAGYGLAAWDAQKYLNIWLCNLSNGLLGYATLPSSLLFPHSLKFKTSRNLCKSFKSVSYVVNNFPYAELLSVFIILYPIYCLVSAWFYQIIKKLK